MAKHFFFFILVDIAILLEQKLEEISFLDLKEFDDTVPQSVKDQVRKKTKKKKKENFQEKGKLSFRMCLILCLISVVVILAISPPHSGASIFWGG